MAFFGLPERDLAEDRPENTEDLAVYTWGEESYDGLGDVLQEGGDELNDETFGSTGPIGKDFDFSSTGLPDPHPDQQRQPISEVRQAPPQRREERPQGDQPRAAQSARPAVIPSTSLESLWHDQSAFSAMPRVNGSGRLAEPPRVSPVSAQPPSSRFSPFADNDTQAISHAVGQLHQSHQRIRTLQDIEAEMLANAQQARQREREQEYLLQQEQERLMQERLAQQQLQQHLLQQQQQQQRLREEEARQRLLFQEQQQQQQAHVQRLLQQQREQQLHQQRTPPPRMIPSSQSPRFLEHRQLLLLQQQQLEQQLQQQRLHEIEEQLRLEEVERRLHALNMERNRVESPYGSRRASGFPAGDAQEVQQAQLLQLAQDRQLLLQQQQQQQQYRRQRSRSPAVVNAHYPTSLQEEGRQSYQQPQNVQLQQRLLADLAHSDLSRDLHGASPAEQEALRVEAMRKIVEAEKMEEKRRRKAAKIAHMARYNDLMTQSDKDFITRIQVSQLVTQDPYADDFYAQVYGAIMRSRMGLQAQDERVLKFGSGGGIGLGLASKGGNRRPSAMQRMEQQVERIVSNARKREEEKGLHAVHSLQGALGKTSGRSYKAAPRQLLQVDSGAGASPTLSHATANLHISKTTVQNEGAAKEAAKLGREALGVAGETDNLVRKDPLTNRQVLVILEGLYDTVLRVEQLRRDQPPLEDVEASQDWKAEYDNLVDGLWEELRVMVPLETSDPHPFISLITPAKGKRILPRLTRHLSSQRMLTLLTLLVACFNQLDVVKEAPILDSVKDSQERSDAERQTHAFLGSVMQSILPVVSVANLRLVSGLLGLLLDRSDIVAVARTRPGLALLTLFLSRVEVIKQTITASELTDTPTLEESQQWRLMFDHLFQLLAPHLLSLFPSARIVSPDPSNNPIPIDIVDQPVWQFLAALALHGVIEQHHVLVASLREKILDNVLSVNKGWVHDEDERQTKLANVNLFLHAVNLDSSQIAM
ncbi:topoisomerase II-associated protein PAT1 [Gymnopilus junonius]|uniref:Topoisomerase II-associated protein PAT1 n=1 Tax=Gymnopilus junonius TaxID=109634 RepID=A0A9P5TSS8_GYMJU|nr:topoisomerase II-associated protein PAT1 [Gymnopilus junonius]